MAKYDELVAVVNTLNPSIILLTETWLKPHIPDSLVDIPGFTLYRSDRTAAASGGVCMYISQQIITQFSLNELDFSCPDVDTLALQISNDDFTFTLACVYRPKHLSLENNLVLFQKI